MKRSEIELSHKWNVEEIFSSVDEWEKLYSKIEQRINFSHFEGKLNNESTIFDCFETLYSVQKDLEMLCVYAYMRHDENTVDNTFNVLMSKSDALEVKFSTATSFITPELTLLSTEKLTTFANSIKLKNYNYLLKEIIKNKPHVLSKETENVLALGGQVFGGYSDVFTMLNNADIDFPHIVIDGKKIKLTHGLYGVLLYNENREIRKKVFKKYYAAYKKVLNTISSTYIGSVNKDVFFTKARKYDCCLDKALNNEDIPKIVYDNLLESVNKNINYLHLYVENKKQVLGVDELHMYDMYTPLVNEEKVKYTYNEAQSAVKEGLKVLGDEYQNLLDRAFKERWIDVEESENKRSGAYSIHAYGYKHPYVLLNYQGELNDVFTLAHELGHAMHSYFSSAAQPISKADYTIFLAEIASTVNEVLLLKHMVKSTNNLKLKKYLLSYYMDMIKGTLFRQTMFAEFEFIVHSMAEKGIPLTKEELNKIYYSLNQKYYGNNVVSDKEIAFEWARIPHFYRAFYVYKYSTGIISAITIAERILSLGDKAVKDYLKFLSTGGSDSPVELLKIAGVDLTKKDAFDTAMQSFKNALDEFKKI